MKRLLAIIVVLLLFSCKNLSHNNSKNPLIKYSIQAELSGISDSTKIVLTVIDSRNFDFRKIDSVITTNGLFSFKGLLNKPEESLLTFYDLKNKDSIINFFPFWIENADLILKGNLNKIEITNSPLNSISKKFQNFLEESRFKERKELDTVTTDSIRNLIRNKYNTQRRIGIINLIYKYPNNFVSITELIKLQLTISKDSLQLYYNQLNGLLKNSEKGISLHNFLTSKRLVIGEHFIDFTARDLAGNSVKLSDFKGKVILLDFWAWWCGSCHFQNRNEFPSLIAKYKKDDFVIISYSLDTNKDLWKKSSLDDNITWVNISNLKGMDDPIAIKYNLQALPNSFLINKKGIVIESFLGYDPKKNLIEKEIDKLLKYN